MMHFKLQKESLYNFRSWNVMDGTSSTAGWGDAKCTQT